MISAGTYQQLKCPLETLFYSSNIQHTTEADGSVGLVGGRLPGEVPQQECLQPGVFGLSRLVLGKLCNIVQRQNLFSFLLILVVNSIWAR